MTLLQQTEPVRDLRARLAVPGPPVQVEGPSGAGKAALLASVLDDPGKTALVLTFSDERATQLAEDLQALLGGESGSTVLLYPSIASALYDGVEPEPAEVAQRLQVLGRLVAGAPTIVVAPIKAALHLTMPPEALLGARRTVAKGEQIDREDLLNALLDLGYERVALVDDVGQFSARGGIIDVSPPTEPRPVRIELFGDEVDSLRHFDAITQRSLEPVEQVLIGPAGEILLTAAAVRKALPAIRSSFRRELDQLNMREKTREAERLKQRMEEDLELLDNLRPQPSLTHYLPFLYDRPACLLAYLPEDAQLVVDEPVRIKSHAEQFEQEVKRAYDSAVKLGSHLRLPTTACLAWESFLIAYLAHPRQTGPILYLTMLQREVPWAPEAELRHLDTPPVDSFGGRFELLVEGLSVWQEQGRRLLVATNEPDRMTEVFATRGLSGLLPPDEEQRLEPGRIALTDLNLSGGFTFPAAQLIVLTGREIFGWRRLRRTEEPAYKRGFSLLSLRELHEGDYVVHINHGIARYRGLSRQTLGGIEREYMVLEYAGEDKLYVPVTQLDRVQKYIGAEGSAPAVNAMKSVRWAAAKKEARKHAQLLARELMKLYAAREQAPGFAFSPDGPWMAELENAFRYDETPDQLRAIAEVKADMEAQRPMDRLICGDVGYGKTEVAVRAAFKAVLDNKQVAVLTPTTILAQQHFNTFQERLSRYPMEVAMLSRFRTPEQQHRAIEGLKNGTVDLVVGTHRLLSSDLTFKDLGLVIIDEEQRFGVKQKEKLKQLRASVDVVTLSATPIPRTLNMALSGLRQISLIADPPQGRLPIRTFVRETDDELVRQAILREIERGGQVYFVHNRVHSIKHVAAHIQRLVPEALVAVAHGQMDEQDLEQVMLAFHGEECNVLVCTTIIENGLDIANVNTIIVDDAHKLGLAQLYQLRGRVGRSARQAYAYLLYKYPDQMTADAEERLKAIEEFSELGSGFKLALRDLEIRGAGEILGAEQSGQMSSVGLDLYTQMLADAVKTLKGERPGDLEGLPAIDLPVEAVIPGFYVPDERQRIDLYRHLAEISEIEAIEGLAAELRDRYGTLPPPVENLLRIAKLRLRAVAAGVAEVGPENGRIAVKLLPSARLTDREVDIFKGMLQPTLRQARQGARSKLPRASATPTALSFAPGDQGPEFLLEGVSQLIELLIKRSKYNESRNERVAAAK
ncbi:MAG TPA: transcription-repair coupling factor [Armatimonadota bacterium]